MVKLLLLLFFLTPGTWGDDAHADEETAPTDAAPPELLDSGTKKKDYGSSWVPIVGYNPTYEFFLGGGFFYRQPSYDFGIHGVLTFESVYQVMTHWAHRFAGPWRYYLDVEYSRGFEPYYGEGGETRAVDEVKIWGDKTLARPRLGYLLNPSLEVGLYFDIRARGEDRVEGGSGRLFPNETSLGYGLYLELDMRDDPENPTEGYTVGSEMVYLPASLSTLPNRSEAAQLSGNFAVYKEMFAGVIAAIKLAGGASLGDPSYLFKFRLGGTDLLRGYFDNRFRGKKFYLQQTEVRFPIFKILGGAAFLGLGDATDNEFTSAKLAYGLGARINLPPDYVSKIRIDVGFGRDQKGVFVDFGHAF